jgi:hypothetical protein
MDLDESVLLKGEARRFSANFRPVRALLSFSVPPCLLIGKSERNCYGGIKIYRTVIAMGH